MNRKKNIYVFMLIAEDIKPIKNPAHGAGLI